MASEFFSLHESTNPDTKVREMVLHYERTNPSQTIHIRADDWHDFLMEQTIAWAQCYPSHFSSHCRFEDLKTLIESSQKQKVEQGPHE